MYLKNVDLLEKGVALKARTAKSLVFRLAKVLSHPERIQEMREDIARIAKPQAAFTVANELVKILSEKTAAGIARENR